MAKVKTEQQTRSYRWRKFRGPIVAGAEDTSIVLSHVLSGYSYQRRTALGAQSLTELFKSDGSPPNVAAVRPVIGGMATLTCSFRFEVGVFKGYGNSMDRICLVSARPGGWRTSSIAPPPGEGALNAVPVVTASAYYCEEMGLVNDYGNTVDLIDASDDNGKGYLAFDLNGATDIVINTVSTIIDAGQLYFEIGGLY